MIEKTPDWNIINGDDGASWRPGNEKKTRSPDGSCNNLWDAFSPREVKHLPYLASFDHSWFYILHPRTPTPPLLRHLR